MIKSYIAAVKFLLKMQKQQEPESRYSEENIKVGRKDRKVYIFRPTGKTSGTIVILHGMSPLGPVDKRMIGLCQAVADSGYQVICPEVQEIKDLTISSRQITVVRSILHALKNARSIEPFQRYALMAPSFSAAVCFAAAADEELNAHVGSMCSLGTFANVKNVVQFFFSSDKADNYGRLIVMRNFLEMALGKNPRLKKAFSIAIEDNWHNRNPGLLPAYLEKLPRKDRQFFEKIASNEDFRMEIMQKILKKDLDEFETFNITSYAKDLNMPVLLVHGRDDHVIPASESQTMYNNLKENGKESRLLITPFLSHGDTEISLKQLPEIIKLISGFAYFFRYV